MGSKAGLNFNGAKNILALFSAPRRVVIHTGFLLTLSEEEVFSGLGECFRLCATGGTEFLSAFQDRLARYLAGETAQLSDLLVTALAVKRAVIELDEFELNERRAMNYGHSLGHALEALTANEIPHGTAVVLGMLVENEISISEGFLHPQVAMDLLETARPLINRRFVERLQNTDLTMVVDILSKDKKSEGRELKLALMHKPGLIRFHSFSLDEAALYTVEAAVARVVNRLSAPVVA
jgi:3-dehydroquinate synthase